MKCEDCDPPGSKGRGGKLVLNPLDEVSQHTNFLKPPAGIKSPYGYRCQGAERGCATNWSGPRNSARVIGHASLPEDKRTLSAKLGHTTNLQRQMMSKASSSQASFDAPNLSPANSLPQSQAASIKQRPVLEIARRRHVLLCGERYPSDKYRLTGMEKDVATFARHRSFLLAFPKWRGAKSKRVVEYPVTTIITIMIYKLKTTDKTIKARVKS